MSSGAEVIAWFLRHRDQSTPLQQDLILLRDHEALSDAPPVLTLHGRPWAVAHVTGEITLRAALPEEGFLIALVPAAFSPPPDLAGRAWAGRPLEIQPRDLVAAATGRRCVPVIEEELAAAVLQDWRSLAAHPSGGSADGPVSARELRDTLLSRRLGVGERLDRVHLPDLLARWIVAGVPARSALLEGALTAEHGREGAWLAALIAAGSVIPLITAGAHAAALPADLAASLPDPDPGALARLVGAALRTAMERDRDAALASLADAEQRPRAAPHGAFPLLRSALLDGIRSHLAGCAADRPPDDAAIDILDSNLHAPGAAPLLRLCRAAARLARFCRCVAHAEGAAWFRRAGDIAWGDLALRELRRLLPEALPDLVPAIRVVLTRYIACRDGLNLAFATWLAQAWPQIAAAKDRRDALPLHQVSRCLVRPLLDSGQRVLLAVLDGCDPASFQELIRALPDDLRADHSTPLLHDDLKDAPGFAIAPLPTLTSHARRALFAGEIPGSAADDPESAAANSSGDHRALALNPALGNLRRTLLLKGDLGPGAIAAAMQAHELVAVVYNAVDDSLSSKETAPPPAWTPALIHPELLPDLRHALSLGWIVLITADHGHTPFLSADRRIAAAAAGNRYDTAPLPGAVRFDNGPLPARPLYLAAGFGTWAGQQRRGWHGGAAIEEVAVPLRFLAHARPADPRTGARAPAPQPEPRWWWSLPSGDAAALPRDAAAPDAAPPRDAATPRDAAVLLQDAATPRDAAPLPPAPAPDPLPRAAPPSAWSDSITDADVRKVLLHIAQHGAADAQDLLALLGSDRRARYFAIRYESWLSFLPFNVRVEASGAGKRYVRES